MGRITTDTGLISGLPITDTVNKLMQIAARPRDLISARTRGLADEQTALAQMTALVLGVQFAVKKFSTASAFETKTATSSNTALSTSVTGTPAAGTYHYTPLRTAVAQQLFSSGLGSNTSALGGGTFSFGYGGRVDEAAELNALNGGAGVQRGKIRITDRSGATATIDLTATQTIDDVLEAINSNDDVAVTATASGDRIQLFDTTGSTVVNLRVQEVGSGRTAADLGLAGINVAVSSATGDDIRSLHSSLELSRLNDGGGVNFSGALADLTVTFRDGSSALAIDFDTTNRHEQTLGDILTTINESDPTRLRAEIAPDGDHIRLIDLTTNTGGTFAVTSPVGSTAADDLGLTGTAVGDTLTSRRLQGGLRTAQLSSLNGGAGIGTLGSLSLTDRDGDSASVSLAAATSLEDVVNAINAAGIDITASFNANHSGLLLTDTSGGTGNLVVANGDGTNTATKLNLAVNAAQGTVNSGSLHLQTVGHNTLLSSLNGGRGVALGSFLIRDSNGSVSAINLRTADAETVGDVIELINAAAVGVDARLNDTGDGILLTDTAGGTGSLNVQDVGSNTTAADLHFAGTASGTTLEGATRFSVTLDADETLTDLVTKINELDAGLAASLFNDGGGSTPHHLSLVSQATGRAGRVVVESTIAGLSFDEIAEGRDALLLVGGATGGGIVASSSTNQFTGVLGGVTLTVNDTANTPTTVTVAANNNSVISNLKLFVTQYNSLRAKLAEHTQFNSEDSSTGILFGSTAALRIDSDLSQALSGRFFGAGSIRTLAEVGIAIEDDGTLSFDQERAQAKLETDPTAVQEFFTHEDFGAAAKLDAVLERLVGEDNSVLINRNVSLQSQIDTNNERVEQWNARLDKQRERLLNQYYALEQIIAKFQSNLTAISNLQIIEPIGSSSRSNS